ASNTVTRAATGSGTGAGCGATGLITGFVASALGAAALGAATVRGPGVLAAGCAGPPVGTGCLGCVRRAADLPPATGFDGPCVRTAGGAGGAAGFVSEAALAFPGGT